MHTHTQVYEMLEAICICFLPVRTIASLMQPILLHILLFT
uniref:Uncharacterized protein n=1 Tax=Rhizophora mucronata TaxID=61149 RepID=A0A2P2PCF1_RHIMU